MPRGPQEKFGILPSLELLPFFANDFDAAADVTFVARASYGSIAREMLVGDLVGGILPWEIFAAEVLAMSGQRNQWTAAFFSNPSPTELVLQDNIYKALCPDPDLPAKKIPTRLQIGIENRSSLTRHQFTEWLNSLKLSPRPEVVFKFLPMDQRLQGMPANALDGFIARSPWGVIAEEQGLGSLVREFSKEDVSQRLVAVCHKDVEAAARLCNPETLAALGQSRLKLSEESEVQLAAKRMQEIGKPHLPIDAILEATRRYSIYGISSDVRADSAKITEELQGLYKISMLPPQIAPTEQTARLLACQ
ncbi:ABC transporter substrate-binding protein [Luteolibacter sp. AS25]|uniref:ABC transporter substrate-binding protein n=1 Tax=Luteolibacter sp. AS25 TaxID=3135776 RepID=UPI00398B0B16